MLKEFTEDLNSIKKIQSETKGTLTEIKNNLRETTVEWMKLRIKSMIWNIRKKKTSNRYSKKKKNPTIEGSVKGLWDNFKVSTFTS